MTCKCPVAMRYDRQGKRTISCNQEVHDEELEHHFRSAHGITSEDMVKFYVTKAKTEYYEAKYEN
jgi:hypothetical protein